MQTVHSGISEEMLIAASSGYNRAKSTFLTLFPCPEGHFERYIRNGECAVCRRIALKAYRDRYPGRLAKLVKRWLIRHPHKRAKPYKDTTIPIIESVRPISHNRRCRESAKANGYVNYSTGYTCDLGHNSARYTSTGSCILCVRKRATSWNCKYRREPRDAIKGIQFKTKTNYENDWWNHI